MNEKKAKELLIKSGLSERKAGEISGHLARVFNEENKKKDEEVKEVKIVHMKSKNLSEVVTRK